jgi:energy-converting hydrogenase Eha subunit H
VGSPTDEISKEGSQISVHPNHFKELGDHMSAVMLCIVFGLVMGKLLTGSVFEFATLFIVSLGVSLVTFNQLKQRRIRLKAQAGYCCSVMVASDQMLELFQMGKAGQFMPLLGEIPELIIGGFLVPAIAVSAVQLFRVLMEI